MKYATFNDAGELNGRYDSTIHSAIPEAAIELSEELYMATRTENDGIWMLVDGKVVKTRLSQVEADYPALFAVERFAHEVSGICVDGLYIETTRDSQALIASTALSVMLDPEYRCNFKTLRGFVEIGSEQILVIAKAVRVHIQACFDREHVLLQALESGTYSSEMLTEGWPDSSPVQPNPVLQ